MELEGTKGICEAPVWQCLKYINDDVNNRCHFLLYYFPEEKPHKMLMAFQRLLDFNFFRVDTSRPTPYIFILISVKSLATVLHDTTVKNCSTNKTVLLCLIRHYLQGSTRGCTRISELYSEWNAWGDVAAFPVGLCAWQRYNNLCQILLRAYCSFLLLGVYNMLCSPHPPPPPTLHKLLSSNALGKIQCSQEHLKTMVYARFGGQTACIVGDLKIV